MEYRGGMESIHEIYTKYIQYIQNGCLKKAKLSKIPFWGRFAAPNGCLGYIIVLSFLGSHFAYILYISYIDSIPPQRFQPFCD